jgi:hypothetical protein
MRRARERGLGGCPVTGLEGEGLVAGIVGPYRRCVCGERSLRRDDGGERLVLDRDQLGGVLRLG